MLSTIAYIVCYILHSSPMLYSFTPCPPPILLSPSSCTSIKQGERKIKEMGGKKKKIRTSTTIKQTTAFADCLDHSIIASLSS